MVIDKYFMADPHFFHENIITYCNRPYPNVEVMKRDIINNCNRVLSNNSILYIAGDFCLKSAVHLNMYKGVLNKIKGKKVLILGNHDELKPRQYLEAGFYSVHTSLDLTIDGIDFTIVHDPSISVVDRERLFICGHIHDLITVRKNMINVCVELWNYTPVSWEQIKEIYLRMVSENFNYTL